MPIIPVTKIPTPPEPTFPEYRILNNEFQPFKQGASITVQNVPVYSLIDEEVDITILELWNAQADSVQFPMPSNGILSTFRYFQIENDTALTFDLNFFNATKATTITAIDDIGFAVGDKLKLFTNNSLEIVVAKGDLVNWQLQFGSAPASGKHIHSLYIAFNFKPTSSA